MNTWEEIRDRRHNLAMLVWAIGCAIEDGWISKGSKYPPDDLVAAERALKAFDAKHPEVLEWLEAMREER